MLWSWLLWLCRLVALGAAVVVIARAVGGEQKTPLVELAVMVPITTVVTSVALLAALVLAFTSGGRWTAAALAVLLVVQLVWSAPTWGLGAGAAEAVSGEAQPVHVMSINTLTGLADPGAIVAVVRERDIDLLASSELTAPLQGALDAAGLAEELPFRTGRTGWGAEGTVLWSRRPIENVSVLPGTAYGQPRGVVTLASGRRVTVTAVHTLSPIPGRVQRWRADVAALEQGLREVTGPQIVLGDFNATRDHRGFRRLLGEGGGLEGGLVDAAEVVGVGGGAWPGFTWPANKRVPPFMRLDHVLVTPGSIGVESLETVRIPGTDHLGLVATLIG